MTNLITMQHGLAAFAPRARLLRLIGAELISDDVVAITELVKNAHDADASFISLQFCGVAGEAGEIVIRDDGHGMDLDTLLGRWMQPAGSSKGREGTRFTPGGRRVLGEKGVGRFAADKLASHLELVSRREAADTEVHAFFDWDEFEADDRMLSDVHSRWEVRAPDWLDGRGTLIKLTGLRTRWNERMFRRLSTRLARLISPFQKTKGFRILIDSDEFPQYGGQVSGSFLDRAPYRIEAEFDGNATLVTRIGGGRAVRHVLPDHERPTCGSAKFKVFGFDLETEALARIGPRMEVRAWLREWTGISVYRDGFRIWPYGEPHDDWLRLDQRRVNNPVMRLSNNQVVGFVEISADSNPELRDQTNREGLVHNQSLEDLQRLVLIVLQALEAERQTTRHPAGDRNVRHESQEDPGASSSSTHAALHRLASGKGDVARHDLRRITELVRSEAASASASHRRVSDAHGELAALGGWAGMLGGSMAIQLDELRNAAAEFRARVPGRHGKGKSPDEQNIDRLDGAIDSLAEQIGALSAPIVAVGRRRRALDLPTEIHRVRTCLWPLLEAAGATFDVSSSKNDVLRAEMRPEFLHAVIGVLVRNSLDWKVGSRALRIIVTIRQVDDSLEIIFSDNGRGVAPGLEKTLFSPLVSGREDGAGMGLSVARTIVANHGGTLDYVSDRRRKGASFRIRLPRKRSRATADHE